MGRSVLLRLLPWLVCTVITSSAGTRNANAARGSSESGGLGLEQQTAINATGSWLSNPVWSPDGQFLSFTDHDSRGVYLLSIADRSCVKITDAAGSGYACNFSSDGRLLGFKLLVPTSTGEFPLQLPVVFDVVTRKTTALHAAVARCGVPSFAADGRVAFTIDRELVLTDATGSPIRAFKLDSYANLTPISPNGKHIVYNDHGDQLWLLDTTTGDRTQMTKGESYFNPIWSPDSTKLVVSTLAGRLKTIEVATGKLIDLANGSSASWSVDGRRVFFCHSERISGVKLLSTNVYDIAWDGTDRKPTLAQGAVPYITAFKPSPDGKSLACAGPTTDGLIRVNLVQNKAADGASSYHVESTQTLVSAKSTITDLADINTTVTAALISAADPVVTAPMAQIRISGTAPYIHQVYDTPDWFDGNWACGATSAMMGIQYYNTLPYWDTTCSSPYSHVSHYGRYICEIYSFRGYNYNIGSEDPGGTLGYGGYGYIVHNNWLDTKGYMRDYIIQHGLGSAADFSTSWAKLQTEINNSTPFVLLCDLTTSGHYILTIGYFDAQRTAIFNDPYGNKNSGYMNYAGTGVYYDWPGYNNGYQNLNFAECFIYCRGSVHVAPSITAQPMSQSVAANGTASLTITAAGTAPLSYQWRKGGTNLSNAGHYSGVTTNTLTVSSFSNDDVASYSCYVTNAYGNATSNAASLALFTGQYELIVESRAGGKNYANYSEVGVWTDSTGKSAAPGTTGGIGSRYCYVTASGLEAGFSISPPTAGPYDIYITGPYSTNAVASAHVIVATAAGNVDRYVDENSNSNPGFSTDWNALGRFNLNAATTYKVTIVTSGSSAGTGGTVLRADAVKWVLVNTTPPTITNQPVAQSACPGGSVGFTIAATGEGTLSYQWQKGGSNLADGGHYAGVTSNTLTVSTCDGNDAGNYQCVVSTPTGGVAVSNSVPLTLRTVTAITQHPSALSACQGGSVQLSVAAAGDGTLNYRWQKGTSDIFDGGHYGGTGTATLTVSSIDGTDVASYRCVVTGGCGAATSNSGALSLSAPTAITQQPQSQLNVPVGNNVTFTVAATGAGTLSYQWQNNTSNLSNGGRISGATTATLSISTVNASDTANYRCVVTGQCGAAISNEAVLSVILPPVPGDFDGDGDLDLDDYGGAQRCLTEDGVFYSGPPCDKADFDHDHDVDGLDVMMFRACLSGAGVPGDPACPPF